MLKEYTPSPDEVIRYEDEEFVDGRWRLSTRIGLLVGNAPYPVRRFIIAPAPARTAHFASEGDE